MCSVSSDNVTGRVTECSAVRALWTLIGPLLAKLHPGMSRKSPEVMCLLSLDVSFVLLPRGNTHVSRILSGRSPKTISRALTRTNVRHFTFIPVPQEGHATTRLEGLKKWVLPKSATVDPCVRNMSRRKSIPGLEATLLLELLCRAVSHREFLHCHYTSSALPSRTKITFPLLGWTCALLNLPP